MSLRVWGRGLAAAAAAMLAGAVGAAPLPLPGNDILLTAIAGADNLLFITQDNAAAAVPGAAPNGMQIRIDGDRNGGAADWRDRLMGQAGLAAGELVQRGFGNRLDLTVTGSDNLFAMSQTGTANRIAGTVTGHFNQAAVTQAGTGNSLSFSQTGAGNMIVVSQGGW